MGTFCSTDARATRTTTVITIAWIVMLQTLTMPPIRNWISMTITTLVSWQKTRISIGQLENVSDAALCFRGAAERNRSNRRQIEGVQSDASLVGSDDIRCCEFLHWDYAAAT